MSPDGVHGEGTSHLSHDANGFKRAVACVAVKSSGEPVPAVVRPLNVAVDTFASFAFDTTPLSIVMTVPVPEIIISHLSQSVRTGRLKSPLHSNEFEFTVLIFVHDTSIAWYSVS